MRLAAEYSAKSDYAFDNRHVFSAERHKQR